MISNNKNYNFWIFKDKLEQTIQFLIETFHIKTQTSFEEIIYNAIQTYENQNIKLEIINDGFIKILIFKDSDDSEIFIFNIDVKKNFEKNKLSKFESFINSITN